MSKLAITVRNVVSSIARAPIGASIAALGLSALVGCASTPHTELPPNAKVDILQTDKMVLRGQAEAKDNASCKSVALPAKHFVELKDDLAGHMILRPAAGESLKLAVFHLTHLETNRTWCVQIGEDGTTATIPGGFPMGTYAISVTESRATPRYEVVVEKL